MPLQSFLKCILAYFLTFLILWTPFFGQANELGQDEGLGGAVVRIWDLEAAYHAVKRDFIFILNGKLELSPEELNKRTLTALGFVETLNAYLAYADTNQTDLEKAPVRRMAKEINTLLTETMINTLARENNLSDGRAAARVTAYFDAFETKIAERVARFATEAEFQKVRMDQKFPSPSTLVAVAQRDPVLMVYLSFLYKAFDHWRFSFKELRQSQSTGKLMQLISVSGFAGSFIAGLAGQPLDAVVLLGVSASLWHGFAAKDWRQFDQLMNAFYDGSRKYYLPMNMVKASRQTFGNTTNCYDILSAQ